MKDGGPAFPTAKRIKHISDQSYIAPDEPGMTLRQFYAAMAMQGIIARSGVTIVNEGQDRMLVPNAVARGAFDYADAMLAFEEKESKS